MPLQISCYQGHSRAVKKINNCTEDPVSAFKIPVQKLNKSKEFKINFYHGKELIQHGSCCKSELLF
jgi:hypothetical protein